MPSITTENYLKAIYQLQEQQPDHPLVRLGDLSRELEVTPGTITTMIRGLAGRGLVDYQIRHGVRLTATGREEALRVVRRHRLIELFLVKVLHMDWSEVHEDAEALEHAVSDRVLDRIDAMMGHPESDPHGDPIPDADANLPRLPGIPLSEADRKTPYRVSRVDNQDASFLEWVASSGLKPGARVEITTIDPVRDTVTLRTGDGGSEVTLDRSRARRIRVKAVS